MESLLRSVSSAQRSEWTMILTFAIYFVAIPGSLRLVAHLTPRYPSMPSHAPHEAVGKKFQRRETPAFNSAVENGRIKTSRTTRHHRPGLGLPGQHATYQVGSRSVSTEADNFQDEFKRNIDFHRWQTVSRAGASKPISGVPEGRGQSMTNRRGGGAGKYYNA